MLRRKLTGNDNKLAYLLSFIYPLFISDSWRYASKVELLDLRHKRAKHERNQGSRDQKRSVPDLKSLRKLGPTRTRTKYFKKNSDQSVLEPGRPWITDRNCKRSSCYLWFKKWNVFSNQIKDTVKIPLDMITPQYYSETGYRFGRNVTAFYISIEE